VPGAYRKRATVQCLTTYHDSATTESMVNVQITDDVADLGDRVRARRRALALGQSTLALTAGWG
jgi:hypothetical protein